METEADNRPDDGRPDAGGTGDDRGRREVLPRWASLAIAVLAALLFLACASTRALNFDESLALRAGWLQLSHVDAEPSFTMPATLLFAWLARAASDPNAAFVVNRLLVAAAVLAALFYALGGPGIRRTTGWLAVALALSQASFAVHGYEFRYDAAILVGWLLAFRWAGCRWTGSGAPDGAAMKPFALGAVIAWLALHHLKGLFFACGLLGLLLFVTLRLPRSERLRALVRLAAGAATVSALWFGLLSLGGHLESAWRVYASFFELASAAERVLPWTALSEHLAKDAMWWIAAAVAVPVVLWRIRRRDEARGQVLLAAGFAAVPLAFLFVHPHAWPYMLAPTAPFLGLLMAQALETVRRPWSAVALLLVVAAYPLVSGHGLWAPYAKALGEPMARQVTTLRALQTVAKGGERIVDPSGLAYFLAPCRSQWYADTLFSARAGAGSWMQTPLAESGPECRWGLHTYRLGMLPPADRVWMGAEMRVLGGGVLLRKDDPRLVQATPLHRLERWRLESFWW